MPQTFKVEIKGRDDFIKAARAFAKKQSRDLDAILAEGAIATQSEAQRSILSHQSKGVIYEKRNGVTHQASLEGYPPNSDTGALVKNITIETVSGGYEVGSRKGAPWGAWLEFGTSKVGARPWLQPAYDKIVGLMMDKFKKELGKK